MYTKASILVLHTLLLFLCLEILLHLYFQWTSTPTIDPHLELKYYLKHKWSSGYWEEHKVSANILYQPFTIWRRDTFRGQHININNKGIRTTHNSECNTASIKIFMFGGSTMWGTGAPDWGTIPSYLGLELQENQISTCITNWGETAYTSTQGLLALINELQKGNVPNYVLFYDGYNDILTVHLLPDKGVE